MSNTVETATPITNNRYRLQYHLMPPTGWMNDPNGLIFYQGEYHAFYQHYPLGPWPGPMHWGHAKSKDLVHWEHLPIALAPSTQYDNGDHPVHGVWSGSAVDNDGELTLIFTAHNEGNTPVEVQCIARSRNGIDFEKGEKPVIGGPPDDECFGFRDPKAWRHGGKWYLVLGYGREGRGKALLYTSKGLNDWTYVGPAAESDGTLGDMWECPDLFRLGPAADDYVLIFSPMNIAPVKTLYLSGKFDYASGRLTTKQKDRIDYGFDFYAPQTFEDDKGRRIMFGWMNIWGAEMPEKEDGWMGAFTIPRELELAPDGTLRYHPVAELRELRGEHAAVSRTRLAAGTERELDGVESRSAEVIAVFQPEASGDATFGLRVRCSADGGQYTEISYSTAEGILRMNRDHAGAGAGGVSEVSLAPMADGRVKLHLFLDTSSVELFANDGVKTITNRIYPDTASVGIKLFAEQGDVLLESLDVWQLS